MPLAFAMTHTGHKLTAIVCATGPVVFAIVFRRVGLVVADVQVGVGKKLETLAVFLEAGGKRADVKGV